MDPPSIALSLIKALCQRVEDVRTNVSDCRHLAECAKKTVPLLEHISVHGTNDPCVSYGLDVVVEALELAKGAVDECCESTSLYTIFHHANQIGNEIRNAGSTLSYALSLLSSTNVRISGEILDEIVSMKTQLKNVHLSQRAVRRHEMRDLKHVLEIGFGVLEQAMAARHAETKEMKELLEKHCKILGQLQADMEQLNSVLGDVTKTKKRLDDSQLHQDLTVIESRAAAAQSLPEATNSSCNLVSSISSNETPEAYKGSRPFKILQWFKRRHRKET